MDCGIRSMHQREKERESEKQQQKHSNEKYIFISV